MAIQELPQADIEAFAGKMVGVLNSGGLALMISVGHQTGLFDTMAGLPPSTSEEIAQAAGLNERYVREWLGAMVTGRVVDVDAEAHTFRLPPAAAACLTKAAGAHNVATPMMFLALLCRVEDQIIDCFRNGGGVPYSEYAKFQQIMADNSAQVQDAALIETVLPLVPGLVERLEAGIDVADVGCGQGHAINLMAKEFPNSRFVGYDFSEGGIAAAREEAQTMGLSNARFEVKDVATIDGSAKYDVIFVFDAIHDQAKPRAVLKGIHDSLKPDGLFLCSDIHASSNVHENIGAPMAPMGYMCSTFHCMTVSLALDGEGLGAMWGEQKAQELFAEAGFNDVDIRYVDGDSMNSYYVARP